MKPTKPPAARPKTAPPQPIPPQSAETAIAHQLNRLLEKHPEIIGKRPGQ